MSINQVRFLGNHLENQKLVASKQTAFRGLIKTPIADVISFKELVYSITQNRVTFAFKRFDPFKRY